MEDAVRLSAGEPHSLTASPALHLFILFISVQVIGSARVVPINRNHSNPSPTARFSGLTTAVSKHGKRIMRRQRLGLRPVKRQNAIRLRLAAFSISSRSRVSTRIALRRVSAPPSPMANTGAGYQQANIHRAALTFFRHFRAWYHHHATSAAVSSGTTISSGKTI